ncbi:VOC family protein [Devosia sp. A449]
MASSDAPIDIGHVALVVRDLDAVATYYRDVLGLEPLSADGEVRRLGVGSQTLLELRQDKAARLRDPRAAGLFHTAFLLPSRQALADWLGHIARIRAPVQGASDHLVSEAIYLADPEGNGIEVYVDRPRKAWQHSAEGVVMSTEHLDLNTLLEEAKADWRGVPADSVVGHVHLQVGNIAEAEAFYTGVLGMKRTSHYPGGSFYASGDYHHHLATNIWNSRGAKPLAGGETGLAEVVLRATPAERDAIANRAGQSGATFTLSDPWNIPLTIITKDEDHAG